MKGLIFSNCPLIESQGSGYIIVNTRKELEKRGYQLEIIPPEKMEIFKSFGGRMKNYRMAIGMLKWVMLNRTTISKYPFLIFYGAEFGWALLFLKLIGLKMPVIFHSNGLEVHVDKKMDETTGRQKGFLKKIHIEHYLLFKYSYKRSNAIVTLSEYDRIFALSEMGLSGRKVFFNEPCLPDIFFNSSYVDYSRKEKIITYCGSWLERKGVLILEKIIPVLLAKYPGYRFRLIGVGMNYNVEEYFDADVCKQIEVYPLVQDKDTLANLYLETSIFLFPSFCESFGLVLAEAMYFGCAAITGSTGLAASLKKYEEAVVLDCPDEDNVLAAVEQLINDEELRIRLSINGRKRVENLQWSKYGEKFDNIIKGVISDVE